MSYSFNTTYVSLGCDEFDQLVDNKRLQIGYEFDAIKNNMILSRLNEREFFRLLLITHRVDFNQKSSLISVSVFINTTKKRCRRK